MTCWMSLILNNAFCLRRAYSSIHIHVTAFICIPAYQYMVRAELQCAELMAW